MIRDVYLTEWVKKYRVDHLVIKRGLGRTQEDDDNDKQEKSPFVKEESIHSIL